MPDDDLGTKYNTGECGSRGSSGGYREFCISTNQLNSPTTTFESVLIDELAHVFQFEAGAMYTVEATAEAVTDILWRIGEWSWVADKVMVVVCGHPRTTTHDHWRKSSQDTASMSMQYAQVG